MSYKNSKNNKIKKGFIPKTSILGIMGTSFAIQLGEYENKLASVLYQGKNIISFYVFDDSDDDDSEIDQNLITSWLIANLYIPNINPYQIKRSVQVLIKQFKNNNERDFYG